MNVKKKSLLEVMNYIHSIFHLQHLDMANDCCSYMYVGTCWCVQRRRRQGKIKIEHLTNMACRKAENHALLLLSLSHKFLTCSLSFFVQILVETLMKNLYSVTQFELHFADVEKKPIFYKFLIHIELWKVRILTLQSLCQQETFEDSQRSSKTVFEIFKRILKSRLGKARQLCCLEK